MYPRCKRACGGEGADCRLLGGGRSRAAAVKVRCGTPSMGRRGDHGRRRTRGSATARPTATRPGSPAAGFWGTRTPPLPGWHLERGVRLPAAVSPASRPSRPLLPGRKGGSAPLARARVSVLVSSMCIPPVAEGEGEGQEETHVSNVCGASPAPLRARLWVLQGARQDGGGSLASRWGRM